MTTEQRTTEDFTIHRQSWVSLPPITVQISGAGMTAAAKLGAAVLVALSIGANLDGANLTRANLYGANLDGANLTRANLDGANLTRANLDGANLYGANLDGATIKDVEGRAYLVTKQPVQIGGLRYAITIWDAHMQIGCKFYSIAEWSNFSDAEIRLMDGHPATVFWKAHKAAIFAIALSADRTTDVPVPVELPAPSAPAAAQ